MSKYVAKTMYQYKATNSSSLRVNIYKAKIVVTPLKHALIKQCDDWSMLLTNPEEARFSEWWECLKGRSWAHVFQYLPEKGKASTVPHVWWQTKSVLLLPFCTKPIVVLCVPHLKAKRNKKKSTTAAFFCKGKQTDPIVHRSTSHESTKALE